MEQPTHEPATEGAVVGPARIDVHAHYLTAEQRAVLASAPPIYRGFVSWDIPPALEMMDRQGIATAILSMVLPSALFAPADDSAATRRIARSVNEAAAAAIRTHPDRFGAFANLPLPDVDGTLAEIDYALGTLGLDGVVLLTNTNGVYLRHPLGPRFRRPPSAPRRARHQAGRQRAARLAAEAHRAVAARPLAVQRGLFSDHRRLLSSPGLRWFDHRLVDSWA